MVQKYTYLEIFLDDLNRQINLSEFEKRFKLPHQTIKRHLNELIINKIILEIKIGKFIFYKLNLENLLTYEYISICEKERLFSFLNEKPLFKRLYELVNEKNILIFGSSINSDDYNDIDILQIGKNDTKIEKNLKNFEKTYDVKIHLIQTQEKDLTKTFKKEILKNHIIFTNHDYFVNLIYKNGKN